MGNVNVNITQKGATDPLMKKIYMGGLVAVLVLMCTMYSCVSCFCGASKRVMVYRCVEPGCKGEEKVEYSEGETPVPKTAA